MPAALLLACRVQQTAERFSCDESDVALPFQEWTHVRLRRFPVERLQPVTECVSPIARCHNGPLPTGLRQCGIEQLQIGRRPGAVRQIPNEVVQIPALGPRPAQDGMEFPANKEDLSWWQRLRVTCLRTTEVSRRAPGGGLGYPPLPGWERVWRRAASDPVRRAILETSAMPRPPSSVP